MAARLTFCAAAPSTLEGFSGCVVFAQWVPTVAEIRRPCFECNAHELGSHSLFCVGEIVVPNAADEPLAKQARRLSRCERYRGITGIQPQENRSICRQVDV